MIPWTSHARVGGGPCKSLPATHSTKGGGIGGTGGGTHAGMRGPGIGMSPVAPPWAVAGGIGGIIGRGGIGATGGGAGKGICGGNEGRSIGAPVLI